MSSIALKPGILDHTQRMSGLATDRAFAGAIGVTEEELLAVRSGESPSAVFLAGMGDAFGLTLGEMATVNFAGSRSTVKQVS